MPARQHLLTVAVAAALCLACLPAGAAEVAVPAGQGALDAALHAALPGDVLHLAPGRHAGPVRLDRPVSLIGAPGAEIVGDGTGSVVTVTASDVTVSGLHITGSGSSNETLDAGIKLVKGADRAQITDNDLDGNLVGVDVHGAIDALVARNRITGRQDHVMSARGNGVYVWHAPGLVMEDNDIRFGRDGVFVNSSRNDVFRRNRFRDLRFAVHYMYTHNSVVEDNISVGNHLGFAVMYSDDVRIVGNLSQDDRDHGIMLNYANDSVVEGNVVLRTEDKCLFIYNAHKNRIEANRFERCGIGIHFTAGSERNTISGNAFMGNRTQVKYVGTRWVEWSERGRGNYWSDFQAFDLNGDGIADAPYRPNDAMDQILWSQPAARLLLGSPAVQLVRWSQAAFPALLPGGVIDSAALMAPQVPDLPTWSMPDG